MNEANVYNIAFCIRDDSGDYCRHIAVVMISVMEHTNHNILFHIIHDDTLTNSNKEKLTKCAEKYLQGIEFHSLEIPIEFNTIKVIKYLSKGALYKFLIIDALPSYLDKILYLDSDIVVNLDITSLFSINMNGFSIAAVKDKGVSVNPNIYHREIPIDISKYFNSGVMLFDLSQMRSKYNLMPEALTILKKYPNEPFVDQPPFNFILQNDCLFLDETFNYFTDGLCTCKDKYIFHWAGSYKPWQSRRFMVDELYWEYFILTPWGNTMDGLLKYYSKTVEPLDRALLTYPTGRKKIFFINMCKRFLKEVYYTMNKFYRYLWN